MIPVYPHCQITGDSNSDPLDVPPQNVGQVSLRLTAAGEHPAAKSAATDSRPW